MKHIVTFLALCCFAIISSAQCPDLNGAMINSCGTSEGNNEFVLFTTDAGTSAAVSTYRLFYGTGNPPATNALAGSDAFTKTGTGSVVAAAGCTIVEVTNPATIIPGGSKVMFIPASLDQNYDVTGFCGGSTVYVVYIRTNAAGGTNSSWSATGTMANTPTTNRFLQVTYSGSASCNSTNAPVKAYINSWPSNTDGNFVSWNGITPSYTNSGCSLITLPISLISFNINELAAGLSVKWETENESLADYYTLEESTDGNIFYEKERAAAKHQVQNDYSITTTKPLTSRAYYRIKQTDVDGKYFYSSVILITLGKNTNSAEVVLLQNPLPGNDVTIKITSSQTEEAKITVTNLAGALVVSTIKNVSVGQNIFTVNGKILVSGVYIIKTDIAGSIFVNKLIKL
jgi:hypothetical protein